MAMQRVGMLVRVVIPFYKENITTWERAALDNNLRILSAYPICFLYPRGLNMGKYAQAYPKAELVEVSPDWLGTKRGIQGYNEMMMSKSFYDLFSDCEYILICHTDAWVFRDELAEWCAKGYDLVAAPWPMRPRYRHFPLKQFIWLKGKISELGGSISRVRMYGRIGNGGLCLRKVSAFADACVQYAGIIKENLRKPGKEQMFEDVFWALVPESFLYPTDDVAMNFAYDTKPKLCYALCHSKLPMGCHGFMHKSRIGFWQDYIPCIKQILSNKECNL